MVRILSARHLAHWANPVHLPEVVRRVRRRRAGVRWAREHAAVRPSSGAIKRRHGRELDAAKRRVQAVPARFGGRANIDLIYDLCEELEAVRVVETGVAYGWSSLAALLSISTRNGHVWSTDLPYPFADRRLVGIAVPEDLRPFWTLLVGPDREMLPLALAEAGTVDVAHYDSDKSYEGARWAYRQLYHALRPGGVLVADDVDDHVGFRDFTEEVGLSPTVIAFKDRHQGLVVKP
jgi:predicted O-methyltransferase YrrM